MYASIPNWNQTNPLYRPDPILYWLGSNIDGAARLFTVPRLFYLLTSCLFYLLTSCLVSLSNYNFYVCIRSLPNT